VKLFIYFFYSDKIVDYQSPRNEFQEIIAIPTVGKGLFTNSIYIVPISLYSSNIFLCSNKKEDAFQLLCRNSAYCDIQVDWYRVLVYLQRNAFTYKISDYTLRLLRNLKDKTCSGLFLHINNRLYINDGFMVYLFPDIFCKNNLNVLNLVT
jgi:hypothetical protein